MPLSFLFGLVACFATVCACLLNVYWYSPWIVWGACFVLYLWALRIACDERRQIRFPFAAFVFSGVFLLAMQGARSLPVNGWYADLYYVLNPSVHSSGGLPEEALYDSLFWFNDVAAIGAALLISTTVLFTASALHNWGQRQSDP